MEECLVLIIDLIDNATFKDDKLTDILYSVDDLNEITGKQRILLRNQCMYLKIMRGSHTIYEQIYKAQMLYSRRK